MAKSSSKSLPIILFDIDYTLFDVGYFEKFFPKELSRMFLDDEKPIRSLSTGVILNLTEQEKFLDIDKYLEILLSKLNKEDHRSCIENLLFGATFFKGGFYSEVEDSLKHLKKNSRLGIFSQGDEKLQGAKINQSGFKNLFDQELIYIIKPRKLDHLPFLKNKHINEKLFLVDDKLNILHEVKKHIPSLFAIWIKRGKYAEKLKTIPGFTPDATITNLKEVIKLI